MVFSSLFGKKDKDGKERVEDKREGVKTGPAAPGRPASGPTPVKTSTVESKAAVAAAATAKIDAIEKEMALEFTVSNSGGTKPKFEKSGDYRGGAPAAAPAVDEDDPSLTGTFGNLGTATDLLGGALGAHALEINASELAPTIEEVAVLYANGQAAVAVQVLAAAIQEDQLGASTLMAWQMLFELYQQLGKRTEFEDLAIAYAARFETSPPAFVEGAAAPAPAPRAAAPAGSGTVFAFAGTVDGVIAAQLDKLRKAAERQKLLRIDFNKVVRVAPEGAELLLGVLNGLRKSKHEVVFTGTEHMVDVLRGEIEVGRRDPVDHAWMLLLEMYRIMGKQHEFEELSIDYCVTYEVSPPSWEPVKHMRAEAGVAAAAASSPEAGEDAEAPVEAAQDGLVFTGDIEGKAEQALAQLAQYAAERGRVEIDCGKLKRVDFAAAGHLLNALFGLSAKGKQIVFRQVNHLVAALFCVMGIQEVATIERRKL